MAEEDLPILKIVVVGTKANSLGESGVGKSNIISRYAYDKFYIGMNTTIGLEFVSKNIKLQGEELCLQIWDTAGQERFRALNRTFYRNSMGAVIVFSLGDRKSFMNIKRWKDELKEHTM